MVFPSAETAAMPDKGNIFNINANGDVLEWWTTSLALVPVAKTFPTEVPGHYVTIDTKATSISAPVVAECPELDDTIILAFKAVDKRVYAICVSVPTLVKWNPKEKDDQNLDVKLLSLFKLPITSVLSLRPLANTDTHKLHDMVDNLIGKLQLFNLAKIKSVKDLKSIGQTPPNDAIKNMKRAVDAMELNMRKIASERGRTSGDDAENREGGREARKQASKIRDQLIEHAKFYDECELEERFILLKTSEGQVTEETVKEACETIDR